MLVFAPLLLALPDYGRRDGLWCFEQNKLNQNK